MNAVIDNAAIYTAWAMVRDVLNIAFILMLLFSAFATIFQVDKFSYKRILLTLVIMALLVNFSYPIARFIIDLSNVMMYYFVNALHIGDAPSGSFFVKITKDSGALGSIIYPSQGVGSDTTFLLSAVIFTFIYAITLLVIAVMFVIRTVALAILVIFSSLAFTGSFIPFLSSHASSWWNNLFKYAFFGPIMIFMLYIASQMMSFIGVATRGSMDKIAANQSNSPGFIAAVAFFAVPLVILWFGLGVAQSMSIIGASAVTGRGKKFAIWAGGFAATAPFRGTSWAVKQTGLPGGMKNRYDKFRKTGFFGSDKREEREAMWSGEKEKLALEKKKSQRI